MTGDGFLNIRLGELGPTSLSASNNSSEYYTNYPYRRISPFDNMHL